MKSEEETEIEGRKQKILDYEIETKQSRKEMQNAIDVENKRFSITRLKLRNESSNRVTSKSRKQKILDYEIETA